MTVAAWVLGQVGGLTLAAIACGSLISVGLSRWMVAQLYGVGPFDPVTLSTVVVVLGATALLSALRPALQAAWVAPVRALGSGE